MNINEAYPKKYLDAGQFKDGDWELTISECWVEDSEDFNKQPCKRVVLRFEEVEQMFPLSPTNAYRISVLYGEETDNYIGKKLLIGLEAEKKAKNGVAVRIKRPTKVVAPPAKAAPKAAAPSPASPARLAQPSQQPPAPANDDNVSF